MILCFRRVFSIINEIGKSTILFLLIKYFTIINLKSSRNVPLLASVHVALFWVSFVFEFWFSLMQIFFHLWLIIGRMDLPKYSASLVLIYLQFSRGPKTHSNFLFFEYFLQLSNDLNSLCSVRFIHRCFIVGFFPNYILFFIRVKLLEKRKFYQEALRQIDNPGFRISLGIVYK